MTKCQITEERNEGKPSRSVLETSGIGDSLAEFNNCHKVRLVLTHVRNILNKLCVDDRTQVAVRALQADLVS